MSNQETSRDTTSATSSRASEDGARPSALPGGQPTDLFGRSLARVRHFPSQDSEHAARNAKAVVLCGALDELATQYARTAERLGLPTPATYGRKYGDSSPSAALAESMESRLRVLTPSSGGMLYGHRWSWLATPLGARIFRLRASALRTSGNGSGGWPTPTKGNADGSQMAKGASATGRRPDGSKATVSLNHVATMAGWGTPRAVDSKGITSPEVAMKRTEQGVANICDQASLAGWATPRVGNNGGHGNPERATDGKARLEDQVHGWRTASYYDGEKPQSPLPEQVNASMGQPSPRMAKKLGTTASSSPAPTEKRGQLNPAFVRWLMGFPEGWECFAVSATPLSQP